LSLLTNSDLDSHEFGLLTKYIALSPPNYVQTAQKKLLKLSGEHCAIAGFAEILTSDIRLFAFGVAMGVILLFVRKPTTRCFVTAATSRA